MKILIVNDDGIRAEGIWALANALKAEHEVTVVAPESQRSAYSHAITIDRPLKARPYPAEGLRAYEVVGTPADCAILGKGMLVPDAELLISGINRGYNAGSDVHYSGTVGAAMEGAMHGLTSLAVSAEMKVTDFTYVIKYTKFLIEYLRSQGMPASELLNLNLPNGIPKGLRYVNLGKRDYHLEYVHYEPDSEAWVEYEHRRSLIQIEAVCGDCELLDAGYATVTRLTTEWSASDGGKLAELLSAGNI